MTIQQFFREFTTDAGYDEGAPDSVFSSLTISDKNAESSGGISDVTDSSEYENTAHSEMCAALDRLLELHRIMEIERQLVERRYKNETIRWLSAIIGGISPPLSASLILTTIEGIADRTLPGGSYGKINLRLHPNTAAALYEKNSQIQSSDRILIEEDGALPEFTIFADWDAGGLAFDASEAIRRLEQLLTQSIATT
ncbi:MAG: hypothetical protein A3E78_00425 [Alphaproteobacteria bacterium RIFCSPHIGHO2_12_FULL_63_12]|nr:MAG: hypothetical protein A3E78_00425 [Alphaproteobacteria bacterium RIFCSPHIGHO2_12_FULL_63_12]